MSAVLFVFVTAMFIGGVALITWAVVGLVQHFRRARALVSNAQRRQDSTEAEVLALASAIHGEPVDVEVWATPVTRSPLARYPRTVTRFPSTVYGTPVRECDELTIEWARWDTPPRGMPVLTECGVLN